ncbi:thiamine phosphate synthase [Acidaminococcus provencensis]|uniref:thiamine phosphate synthase n=1 Tax=Acidaminococcus provencensis TaxID=2058289 RepID=UPI0022E5EBFF|nr:thiamine phosphate synthase [Acidaminococcus provencensis]
MTKKIIDYSVYLVTDTHCLKGRDFYAAVEEALKAGVTLVQLREKEASWEELLAKGKRVKALCDRYGVPLLIDDNIAAAKEIGAAGVHLGQEDAAIEKARQELGPDAVVGISAHNVAEATEAQRRGADYLGAGALYPTGSKKDAKLLPAQTFRAIVAAVQIPVVGIGGIHEDQYAQVLELGASGCAMISGILGAADITATVTWLKALYAARR